MNGADALIQTLADNGVDACFANPGTSEMHFVSALDREPRVRPVLCLFEGVATGAADGYARMAGKPAAVLLHLGPGYANGGANLHNAKKAFTPVVNVIGNHATYHLQYEAPLTSDVVAWAEPNSLWVKQAQTADEVGAVAAEAVAASYGPPAGVASMILPADCAWNPTTKKGPTLAPPRALAPASSEVEAAARALRGAKKPVILLGSGALTERGLAAAGRLAAAGARLVTDTFVTRLPRGAGRFRPDRMLYFGEMALVDLAGSDLMLLAGTQMPVAFFAYPDKPSVLVPEGCRLQTLADRSEDAPAALEMLADAMGAPALGTNVDLSLPGEQSGELTAYSIGASIARHMPEHAIICDDAVTAGLPIFQQTAAARPHDWLMLTGGAIGSAIPQAVGVAVACPDRKVLSLNGDGAAMYTVQGLWTLVREQLDVTVVIFANHAYRILNIELARTGAGNPGPAASKLLDLGDPRIDWVSLAQGLGLRAERCQSAEAFDAAMARAMAEPGPRLIEAAL